MTTTDNLPRRQLPLPFGHPGQFDSLTPFLHAPSNEEARRMLQTWQEHLDDDEATAHSILIGGPEGSGKSLLLAYLARDSVSRVYDSAILDGTSAELPDDPVIIIDNIHRAEPSDIMRLINLCLEQGRIYALAGLGNPRDWAGKGEAELKDLASRLSATPLAMLEKPDEALMAEAICAMMEQRQVRISREVANAAAAKLKRSFHAVALFVETLDSEALERQKTIDKALVQTVLARIPGAVL